MDDPEFARLLSRARLGDEVAFETLLHAFEEDVRMIVRLRLPRALRGQFDSCDFLQAVWKSVLADGGLEGRDFESPGQFRGYLAGAARNKVLQEYRRRTRSERHDLRREEPLYLRKGGRDEPRDLLSRDATPSQEAQAGDLLERLQAGRTPHLAEMVDLRRQGLTYQEIAGRLGLSDRTVRRALDEIRERFDREEG